MQTLFELAPAFPTGFHYIPDFITEEEERYLIEQVSAVQLHTFTFQGHEANRRVMSFGYDYHFDSRSISKGVPIPEEFNSLIEKVGIQLTLPASAFAELLVTQYPPQSVINWHRDAPPFELIAGISLQTDCTFKLRPYNRSLRGKKSILSFPVKRRSLYWMQGPARNEWEHSIAKVKAERYSITLRTLREGYGNSEENKITSSSYT